MSNIPWDPIQAFVYRQSAPIISQGIELSLSSDMHRIQRDIQYLATVLTTAFKEDLGFGENQAP